MSVIVARKKAVETIETVETIRDKDNEGVEYPEISFIQILCIWYPITFQKESILVLFNFGNKVNAIYPIFAKELGLFIRPTNIRA